MWAHSNSIFQRIHIIIGCLQMPPAVAISSYYQHLRILPVFQFSLIAVGCIVSIRKSAILRSSIYVPYSTSMQWVNEWINEYWMNQYGGAPECDWIVDWKCLFIKAVRNKVVSNLMNWFKLAHIFGQNSNRFISKLGKFVRIQLRMEMNSLISINVQLKKVFW